MVYIKYILVTQTVEGFHQIVGSAVLAMLAYDCKLTNFRVIHSGLRKVVNNTVKITCIIFNLMIFIYLGLNICKSLCLKTHFVPNNCD